MCFLKYNPADLRDILCFDIEMLFHIIRIRIIMFQREFLTLN